MKISEYLTLDEAIKSPTAKAKGIDNTPNLDQIDAMRYVAAMVFDQVREFVGGPLHASSFFRSPELNKAIGGSSTTSQHMKGEAIDIDCDTFGNGTNNDVFDFIMENLDYDQVIGEYPDPSGKFSWVHVSLKKQKNRRQALIKLKDRYILYSDWTKGMV
jgi:zinc D-Ala-D-Ala carboxypeptidase